MPSHPFLGPSTLGPGLRALSLAAMVAAAATVWSQPQAGLLYRPNGFLTFNDLRGLPPDDMGNYYQGFLTNLAAAWIADGTYAAGFQTFWLDDGWQAVHRDADGNLTWNALTLTNGGIPGLVSTLHGLGYKAILYTAYAPTNSRTCWGYAGTDDAHLQQDMNLFAAWGVDGLMFDACRGAIFNDSTYNSVRHEFQSISNALANVSPPHKFWTYIVIPVWPPPPETPFFCDACNAWGAPSGGYAQDSADLLADFRYVEPYASAWNGANFVIYGEGYAEGCYAYSSTEIKVMVSLCALSGSMMRLSSGIDPRYTTNVEVVSLISDPYGRGGRRVYTNCLQEVFVRPLGFDCSGTNLVGVYNGAATNQLIVLTWDLVGAAPGQQLAFRDLWAGTNFPNSNTNLTVSVGPTDILLLKVTAPDSPPSIAAQPQAQTVLLGAEARLGALLAGALPRTCQWFHDGVALPGATEASLWIPGAAFTDSGTYQLAVSNSFGHTTSVPAMLQVQSVIAWGGNNCHQTNVPAVASNIVALASGLNHILALRQDGRVVGWGADQMGQCDVPPGLPGAVAVAAGGVHSLALTESGSVVAWGDNTAGQTNVPAGLTNVIAISAGLTHSLALRADGTVAAWGGNADGETEVPPGLSNVVAISAGGSHSVALRADGTVLAWGSNSRGQAQVPDGLGNVAVVSAGGLDTLALRADGVVVGWGDATYSQSVVPAAVSNAVCIAAGDGHSLVELADGSVFGWGRSDYGQAIAPEGVNHPALLGAGCDHSVAAGRSWPAPPSVIRARAAPDRLEVLVPTERGRSYFLLSRDRLGDSAWRYVTGVAGNGGLRSLEDTAPASAQRFYTVRRQ